ncbi:MAG TPA: AAA family ATPase, partial [Candidatus Eisenbacteria bacterium]|nr:AAA family ATPase [Candidatus Eisenbacteria bacterium]
MTARQRILLVAGRSCAGKSTMGRHLADEHEAYFVEASEVLGQVLGELPGAPHRTPPAGFAYGQVAGRIVELLRKRDERLIVVSGLRTIPEYVRLVEHAPHTELVYVHAPLLLRFQRCQSRLRPDAVALPSAFRSLDANAEHSLLPVARDLARYVLPNRG